MGSFTVWNDMPRIPIVAHIPHASCSVPEEARSQFIIDDAELNRQIRLYTDWHSDDVFRATRLSGGFVIRHDVSRFITDPQRFDDDSQESMATRGLGVIYSHGIDGRMIRRGLDMVEREALLNRYYRPYHARLVDATAKCLNVFGQCTIFDCHTYPSKEYQFERNRNVPRPDIVVGTDWHHTPHDLVEQIELLADRRGWTFGVDKPYAGTYIPMPYYGDGRVSALMIMVKMSLFMNEQTLELHDGIGPVRDFIADVVHMACEM